MRTLKEVSNRWLPLQQQTSVTGLKQLLQTESHVNEDAGRGLRSGFWKAFLVTHHTEYSEWPAELAQARTEYTELRERFLQGPRDDETDSFTDPLSDDVNKSAWTAARRDEELKQEIFQDVERCMPENLYFRQPSTQTMLLDILFIWSRLNPDVSYRQGMHEILAPVVWAVGRDAVEPQSSNTTSKDSTAALLSKIFDASHIEHDSFTIFASIMKHSKSAFAASKAHGQGHKYSNSVSAEPEIVGRSRHILHQQLAAVDPQLASHLIELELAPQLFLMRWIRLLFGREFSFDNCMQLWDRIFAAEKLAESINLVCVAMLLRIRWQLVNADYNSALALTLHYPPLPIEQHPAGLAEDAQLLKTKLDEETGRDLIARYTGRAPRRKERPQPLSATPSRPGTRDRTLPDPHSPHLLPPPRPNHQPSNSFEAVLHNAARSVYSSGERLGVNRAVRDAVGDVRKNVQSVRSDLRTRSHSRNMSTASTSEGSAPDLQTRFDNLQLRNRALAKMLEGAASELWKLQREMATLSQGEQSPEEDRRIKSMTMAVARVQLAQVYLEDPEMPLPEDEEDIARSHPENADEEKETLRPAPNTPRVAEPQDYSDNLALSPPQASPGIEEHPPFVLHTQQQPSPDKSSSPTRSGRQESESQSRPMMDQSRRSYSLGREKSKGSQASQDRDSKGSLARPSLEESPYSWMLGQEKSSNSSTRNAGGFTNNSSPRGSIRRGRGHGATDFLFGGSNESQGTTDSGRDKKDLFGN